jgi:glycerol-3-phosphate dehydrogenase
MSAGAIGRDPAGAAAERFDLIIVGGGMYGIMLALEATRRGLRPLLLERDDFGGATSANSLRILHGGLRYLQRLDLARSLESIRERAWWLVHFPEHATPLPCLMPLRGGGLRRPGVLRLALGMNDLLCRWQAPEGALPRGRLLDAGAVRRLCPALDAEGLLGGAVWHDARAWAAPRLFIEALRWACAAGAAALNRVEATGLLAADGQVAGTSGRDLESGVTLAFRAPVVINAAGPWSPAFAGAAAAPLFRPLLAWNVAFRRAPPSDHALAVRSRRKGALTNFLVPQGEMLLAGTGYAPWSGLVDDPRLPAPLLEAFVEDLNEGMPALGLGLRDVARTYVGFLPAARAGTAELALRPVLLDHGASGGPAGFFSVSGIKLTTARAVADRVLARAFPAARPRAWHDFPRPPAVVLPAGDLLQASDEGPWREALRRAVEEEAALHLDDLLLRRTGFGDDPERALAVAPVACRLLGWRGAGAQAERARLEAALTRVRPRQPADAGVLVP